MSKKFIIIGNGNAVTYKEVFPLIKGNKLWLGNKTFSGGMDMIAGKKYDTEKCKHPKYDAEGNVIINVMMCVWFTNIEHKKRNTPIDLYKKYNPEKYPKYDNYDAIEVNNVKNIPSDYNGVIGVPITFLDKYCPTQFEIVWTTDRGGDGNLENVKIPNQARYDAPTINGVGVYKRILIKKK